MGEEKVDWVLPGKTFVIRNEKLAMGKLDKIVKEAEKHGVKIAVNGSGDGNSTIITPLATIIKDMPGPKQK